MARQSADERPAHGHGVHRQEFAQPRPATLSLRQEQFRPGHRLRVESSLVWRGAHGRSRRLFRHVPGRRQYGGTRRHCGRSSRRHLECHVRGGPEHLRTSCRFRYGSQEPDYTGDLRLQGLSLHGCRSASAGQRRSRTGTSAHGTGASPLSPARRYSDRVL